MTLRDQLKQVVCSKINAPWYEAAGFPRAVSALCEKAFVEHWDRDSFEARVVLACAQLLRDDGEVPEDFPALRETNIDGILHLTSGKCCNTGRCHMCGQQVHKQAVYNGFVGVCEGCPEDAEEWDPPGTYSTEDGDGLLVSGLKK